MHAICKPIDIFLYDQVPAPAYEIPPPGGGLPLSEEGK